MKFVLASGRSTGWTTGCVRSQLACACGRPDDRLSDKRAQILSLVGQPCCRQINREHISFLWAVD